MASILVLDDERSIREMLEVYLRRQGHKVTVASTLEQAVGQLSSGGFDLVLTDLKLGKESGLAVLDVVRNQGLRCEVIVMTAFSTVETAVQAMRSGAYDYVQKPFNLDELKILVERALERRDLMAENTRLRIELGEQSQSGRLIGKSHAVREVMRLVEKVAGVKANVLITGESGVGKEVVAREIHLRGPRHDAPFLAINCGAIPEGLIESELFGHVKGAFTGATNTREGLLAAAKEGTLFLDEIGELPLQTQVKLLRVIQERKARPVGSTEDFEVGARLIAATNRDLAEEVTKGRFREDLYYRLNVIHIRVPPLRERREDILPLAEKFLLRHETAFHKHWTLSKQATQRLLEYEYPGNVRELENLIERATALADGDVIGPEVLPENLRRPGAAGQVQLPENGLDLDAELAQIERQLLGQALERSNGVKMAAAKLLGMSFRSFRYRLEKLGMSKPGEDVEDETGPVEPPA
jgi:two-component system response regulator PilR (NtrC family)